MVGDHPHVDIIGGKQAGMQTILVETGIYKKGDKDTQGADHVVSDVLEAVRKIISLHD